MIKVLFVTHDISVYGASKSLQSLLKNYNEDIQIDLLINKRLLGRNNLEDVRNKFGSKVNKIYQCHLPLDLCEIGKPNISFYWILKSFISWVTKYKFNRIVKNERYDIIYLNSIALHQLVNEEKKFIIHVREIFDFSKPNVFQSLMKARGVIFIDDATYRPFRNLSITNQIILNNPFDMRSVENSDTVQLKRGNIDNSIVFSVIGQLKESKGTKFIIESFVKANRKDALLLIVGSGDKKYVDECKSLVRGNKNVIFYGEESYIERIYKISDYIIRGEPNFCLGRTIYEGLFSGCRVLVPGSSADQEAFFEYDNYKEHIHLYKPGSVLELVELITSERLQKVTDKKCRSNLDKYTSDFHLFLLKCMDTTSSNLN